MPWITSWSDTSSSFAMRNATVVLTSDRPEVISTRWLCEISSARSTVNQLPNRARPTRIKNMGPDRALP